MNTIALQSLLATTSGTADLDQTVPHHPITCHGILTYDADGCFACEHATVPAEDERTQACLNHSMALLLIEIAETL